MFGKTLGKYNPFRRIKELEAQLKTSLELNERLSQELAQSERIKLEYFEVIEQVLAERDRWRLMYKTQASEHLTGQNMLVRALEKGRMLNAKLQRALNTLLKKYEPGSPLVSLVPDPADPPADQAQKYQKAMEELEKSAPEPLDGLQVRADISVRDHRDT